MSRRRLILEEMGLTPSWRLRSPEHGTARDTSPVPSPEHDAPPTQPKRRKPTDPVLPAAASAPLEGTKPAVGADATERREAILRMDWTQLRQAVCSCIACPLHAKRTNTVFGVGDERARWLFVGEGPGADEDAKGEPFVGQAGRLLDNMLAAIDLERGDDVFIANVVKCRPPGNRNPEPGEMRSCEPFLTRQIELIQPKLIVALGKVSASHLLQTDASIASLRGRVHDYRGTPLIVTYHPAYLLRSLQDKAKAWADLCFTRDTMRAFASQSG
jgi:uracil-DNA glycosylase family 4